jgi:hypothetical protein
VNLYQKFSVARQLEKYLNFIGRFEFAISISNKFLIGKFESEFEIKIS